MATGDIVISSSNSSCSSVTLQFGTSCKIGAGQSADRLVNYFGEDSSEVVKGGRTTNSVISVKGGLAATSEYALKVAIANLQTLLCSMAGVAADTVVDSASGGDVTHQYLHYNNDFSIDEKTFTWNSLVCANVSFSCTKVRT